MAKNTKEAKNTEVLEREKKVNPSDDMAIEDAKKVRAPGNWIKATEKEIIAYENDGILVGHDPVSGSVLLKDKE